MPSSGIEPGVNILLVTNVSLYQLSFDAAHTYTKKNAETASNAFTVKMQLYKTGLPHA